MNCAKQSTNNCEVTRLIEQEAGLEECVIRLRMSHHDAHYGGQLVDGARMLGLFGDVATELLIRLDGDEGLFVAYDKVEFRAPVYAGDYIEARGRITRVGKTSRAMEFTAYKVVEANILSDVPSAARALDPPQVVTYATGTCVVPLALQRHQRGTSEGIEESSKGE